MALANVLPRRRNLCVSIALSSVLARAQTGLTQELCSTQNTGSDYNAVTDIYQSNGACYTQCSADGYAYAVVQWQQCWCSDYTPASQSSVESNCNQSCPGFPDELCGNLDTGYFGYVALGPQPSGTAGSNGATSSTSSSVEQSSSEDPATSYVSTTVFETVTQTPSVTISYVTPTSIANTTPSPTPTPSSTRSTRTSTSSTTPTPTPVTTLVFETVSGTVVTQTVTSTPVLVADPHPDTVPIQRKDGISGGAIGGIVVGVLVGLAILALAAFLLWRRKRNANDTETSGTGKGSGMTRNVSVLSKAGLLTRGTQPSMSERDHDEPYYPTPANGSNSVRHSMMFGGADGVSPASPLDSSHSGGSRRPSKPMVYDQRLNPSALFANQEANGSRISMQDTEDYSRPLGVMNPDPRPSFESRKSHA